MTVSDTAVLRGDDDEGLVKKIKMMKEKRQLTEGYGWSDYTERYFIQPLLDYLLYFAEK